MTGFLQTFYVFLWIALAAVCFIFAKKAGPVGFALAGFFVFMAVWYSLRAFWALPVFDGVWSYIFRGVLLLYLIFIVVLWFLSKRSPAPPEDENKDEQPQSRSQIWDSIESGEDGE